MNVSNHANSIEHKVTSENSSILPNVLLANDSSKEVVHLTKAESLILELIAHFGFSVPEAAASLHRAISTVTKQSNSLQRKLGAKNIAHAISRAYQLKILDPSKPASDETIKRIGSSVMIVVVLMTLTFFQDARVRPGKRQRSQVSMRVRARNELLPTDWIT